MSYMVVVSTCGSGLVSINATKVRMIVESEGKMGQQSSIVLDDDTKVDCYETRQDLTNNFNDIVNLAVTYLMQTTKKEDIK